MAYWTTLKKGEKIKNRKMKNIEDLASLEWCQSRAVVFSVVANLA